MRSFGTTKAEILVLAAWLHEQQVDVVVMEFTSGYWRAPFFRLEAEGFSCELLDAKQVKALPGRPKTDKADCVWLAKVAERGMAAKCFVPPEEIRRLRTLTRYRRHLTEERSREKARAEKLLEDAPFTELPGGRSQDPLGPWVRNQAVTEAGVKGGAPARRSRGRTTLTPTRFGPKWSRGPKGTYRP